MLAHVRAIYQHVVRFTRQAASARRPSALNVVALEDRCTPASLAVSFPLLHPPENAMQVQIAFAPVLLPGAPVFLPTFAGNAQAAPGTPLVRTDLFGAANAGASIATEDDGDFAVPEFAATEETAFELRVRHQPDAEAVGTTEAMKDADQADYAPKGAQETTEPVALCVMLEYDTAVEAE